MNQPAISIITPMYNVAGILKNSFESVVAQTQRHLELIYVDDCSKDDTLSVLDKLRAGMTRDDISIQIIRHKINRGVAAARNTGLDHASGKYIYFLDSDDYLDNDALEIMFKLAESQDADIVGCDWKQKFTQSEKTQTQPDIQSPDDAFCKLSNGVMRWNLWLYLIRRDMYDGMRFIEKANMGEDMMLMLKMVLNAKRIVQTHQVHYHYVVTNPNALTKAYMKHRVEMDINQAELFSYVSDKRPDLLPNMYQLQLALKLPLLISQYKKNYEEWITWFPESNEYISNSIHVSRRIRILQQMAAKRQFWFLWLHYWLITKIVYGILYR